MEKKTSLDYQKHISKFDTYYKSHGQYWMDNTGDFWLKHSYNTRNQNIVKIVESINPHSILDIGCGTGDLAQLLKKEDRMIVGVEPSKVNAGKFFENTHLPCYTTVAEKLPFVNEAFEMAILADVIEHVVEPIKALEQAFRVLCKGGHLIITTPNKNAEYFWMLTSTRAFRKIPVKDSVLSPKELKHLVTLFDKKIVSHKLQEFYPRSRVVSFLFDEHFDGSWRVLNFISKLKFLNYRQVMVVKNEHY